MAPLRNGTGPPNGGRQQGRQQGMQRGAKQNQGKLQKQPQNKKSQQILARFRQMDHEQLANIAMQMWSELQKINQQRMKAAQQKQAQKKQKGATQKQKQARR